jgi:hypothetical protein
LFFDSLAVVFGQHPFRTRDRIQNAGGFAMKRNTIAALTLGLVVLVGAAPVLAHHAFSAEFDRDKRVEKRGFVTKVDWTNPHVWFYINVKDEKTGAVTNWGFEMGPPPPHGLQARGWTRELMKIGDEVIVTGSLAKNGSKRVNASTVILAKTGKTYGAASSEETGQ